MVVDHKENKCGPLFLVDMDRFVSIEVPSRSDRTVGPTGQYVVLNYHLQAWTLALFMDMIRTCYDWIA